MRTKKVNSLTKDQVQALAKIKKWMNSKERYFRLSGYAGTGKSYLVALIVKQFQNLKIIAACPTNKAAHNLKKLIDSHSIALDVTTNAKLLHQMPEINFSTGNEEFITFDLPSFDDYDLIIFDEFSMIGKDNFLEIQKALFATKNTKVLFIGDPAQLPPIKEEISPVAKLNLKFHYSLTEVIRYDGEISKIAEKIRSDIIYNKLLYPFSNSEDKTVICISFQELDDVLKRYFKSAKFRKNNDYVRMLAFKNKTCDFHNMSVRAKLHGRHIKNYNIGDILISKKPLFRLKEIRGEKKWIIIINNSEEMKVTNESELNTMTIKNKQFDYFLIPIITFSGLQTTIQVLTPESRLKLDKHLQSLADDALNTSDDKIKKYLWHEYYKLQKTFDDVTFAYCLTTHKAQGSTFDNVILDIADLNSCSDKQKIIYTALTRAKKSVFILQ
jgi:ATP-dependent exoDNAse (exonuclease V) alpha subunit